MKEITLVAAMDELRGIGKNNQLLCHLPRDLKHFKEITMGKPIVMGRRTYESIGFPLPGRLNIVLSNQDIEIEGVTVMHSLDEVYRKLCDYEEIMIIGGANIFEQSFAEATQIHLTIIHNIFEADTHFPNIESNDWAEIKKEFHHKDGNNAYDMSFYTYQRKSH